MGCSVYIAEPNFAPWILKAPSPPVATRLHERADEIGSPTLQGGTLEVQLFESALVQLGSLQLLLV